MPSLPWYTPTTPAQVKPMPWLSLEAIAYLESLLFADMTVLEHGSGGSTLWFSERVKHVTAVEQNLAWYQELVKRIPQNVTLTLGQGVYHMEPVDLLLIDGEPVQDRNEWINAASQLIKPGGYVVLDNANRPEYAHAREELQKTFTLLKTVDGNQGGSRYLVTEFYQL